MVSTRRPVAAAATPGTAALLAGAARSATVVHSGADAAYLQLPDGGCVAVLSVTARAVPCGLRTTLPTIDLPQGATAVVGDDLLRTDDLEVRVGRLVDAAVPPLPDPTYAGLTTVRDHPAVRAVRAELPDAALRHLAAGDAGAATDLLGRGSGLTPVGDDVLCGYLATAVAAGRTSATATVADEVARLAPRRTTALSAQLLACAISGDVLPEFAALVCGLADPAPALDELVRVGHTSGAGLALGLTLAPITAGRTPA